MDTEATRPPKVPPAWFVHVAWRVHRALYKLSGGRVNRSVQMPKAVAHDVGPSGCWT